MKKIFAFLVSITSLITICYGQDLKTSLDYQYKRGEVSYSSYAAYLNNEENAISLSIASNYKLDDLQFIKVKFGQIFINVTFSKLDVSLTNDDKTINSLAVKLDLQKLMQENIDCETIISFQFSSGNKIELPFMFCKMKEKLKI